MQRAVDDPNATAPHQRIAHYRGAACVSLDALEFDGKRLQPSDSSHAFIFQDTHNKRWYSELRIPALVDSCTFEAAIGLSGTSRESLLATPQSNLPFLRPPDRPYPKCLRVAYQVMFWQRYGHCLLTARGGGWICSSPVRPCYARPASM